ncbi:unnamed protein product [Cylindrotheca closterium]|uniref:Helicase-associated domain-containing protein n=1 Tax=Cylindrotheca closterium TaxID=2856 RepID=A0AAD2JMU7_9STRA|nr:unnamed protein product [Cylindrotheca closterium]
MTTATMMPVDICKYLVNLELIVLEREQQRRAILAAAAFQHNQSHNLHQHQQHKVKLPLHKMDKHHNANNNMILPVFPPSSFLQHEMEKDSELNKVLNRMTRSVSTESSLSRCSSKSYSNKLDHVQPLSNISNPQQQLDSDFDGDSQPPAAKRAKHKDVRWLSNLEQLREYKEQHGDCVVPRGFSGNPRLASWVAEQRKQRKLLMDGKQSSMIPGRIRLLDDLGFVWNAQEAAWDRQLTDLKAFQAKYGHCLVTVGHAEYPKLGSWVKEQRRHHVLMEQGKASNMSAERAAKLDAVGFCWNTHQALWLERFHELDEYKKLHGHSVVPTKCQENQRLGTWVHHQRREYKKYQLGKPSHMTAERIEALESLDFVWYPRDNSNDTSSSTKSCGGERPSSPCGSILSTSSASMSSSSSCGKRKR